ncbi:MAG TPA: hypothetical protein VD998_01295 [Verrucomicrobiae bacterium]|nr:hypothetical protein [Verrucomicrobiae bacterium]
MKRWMGWLAVPGFVLLTYWGMYGPMDEETMLARYTDATYEEIMAARERATDDSPPTWPLVLGIVLVAPFAWSKLRRQ